MNRAQAGRPAPEGRARKVRRGLYEYRGQQLELDAYGEWTACLAPPAGNYGTGTDGLLGPFDTKREAERAAWEDEEMGQAPEAA